MISCEVCRYRGSSMGSVGLIMLAEQRDASAIKAMSLDDVVKAYDAFVRPSSGRATRKKFSVHLVSQRMEEDEPTQETAQVLGDETLIPYKASLSCYPAPIPVERSPKRTNGIETRANL